MVLTLEKKAGKDSYNQSRAAQLDPLVDRNANGCKMSNKSEEQWRHEIKIEGKEIKRRTE